MIGRRFPTALILSAGVFLQLAGNTPADPVYEPDTTRRATLDAVVVTAPVSRRMVKSTTDGSFELSAKFLDEQASLLGSSDPMAVVRTLPSVATANDLQAKLNVRGSSTGSNLYTSDNARVVNPLHMLGFFSAYNPSYYKSYTFRPGRVASSRGAVTSAMFSAESGMEPDSTVSGSVAVGLIESHGAVRVPLRRGLSVAAGLRQTYLNAVFPRLLTLDSSRLGYDFTDVNFSGVWAPTELDAIRVSYFGNRDRMTISNGENGAKEGHLGWNNSAASATWRHGELTAYASYSYFSNLFNIEEGGRTLDLPSTVTEVKAAAEMPVRDFTLGADLTRRRLSGQNGYGGSTAMEYNLSGDYTRSFGRARLTAGLRMSLYHCRGRNMWKPQPRMDLTIDIGRGYDVYVAASRRVRFDRLVEESSAGLPADFWAQAGAGVHPEDVYTAETGVQGYVGSTGLYLNAGVYGKLLRHTMEWDGSLVNLTSADYNPLEEVLDGRGYSAGLTLSLMRQTGKVRGRAGYTLSVSRSKFGRFGDEYLPSSHDRPHDLNVSVSYTPLRALTVSGSYTYASGTPYTRAKYGYMIGENLICEYYPHNSSRLPAYSRLDLSASWTFRQRGGRFSHVVNVSVYNALGTHNVLFRFASYSGTEGLRLRESVMKAVIPSVSYTFKF